MFRKSPHTQLDQVTVDGSISIRSATKKILKPCTHFIFKITKLRIKVHRGKTENGIITLSDVVVSILQVLFMVIHFKPHPENLCYTFSEIDEIQFYLDVLLQLQESCLHT
ncbi:hypothetical protein GIB67_030370 [Kingdonia uniflora]|uniref:Uncharacterized protein n=1 Tax=Kingdonia uniflora TaxID=39325 RepID=A0A7J7M6R2_9MAGN|nr:hypothetical protein GIB67_030370 [Kingdonia uniflora]